MADGPLCGNIASRLRQQQILLAAFAVVLVIALAVPLPIHGRGSNSLSNMCHAPAFAVLSLLVFRLVGRSSRRSPLFVKVVFGALIVTFGAVLEMLQSFVGRQPSSADIAANACGTIAATFFWQPRTSRRWQKLLSVAVGSVMLLVVVYTPATIFIDSLQQRLEMPQIATFESARELNRWSETRCDHTSVREHATHGDVSLRVDLFPGHYSGVILEPAPDWSGYDQLRFDVFLAGTGPLNIHIKIYDAEHVGEFEDRFNHQELLQPGATQIGIPLADVVASPSTRTLEIRQVSSFSIFTVSLQTPRTFYIDNIRLE